MKQNPVVLRIRLVAISCSLLLAMAACFRSRDIAAPFAEEAATDSSAIVRHARGFRIEDKGDHLILRIQNPFLPDADAVAYALVKKDTPAPEGFPADRVIRIPIRSIAVTSNLHVGAIDRLEAWDALTAVGDASQVFSEAVLDRIRSGKITEIQKGMTPDEERIIGLQPDVLMVSGSEGAFKGTYAAISNAGIPVIANSEWMETTPLGRAEWIMLMAVLLDRLNVARHQFAMVENTYLRLAERAATQTARPGVLLGNEYQGTWHMPGGKSFMARLLNDAGAGYHWKNNDQTGSIALNYESVYPVALDADVWLNIYLPTPKSGKKALLATDGRYADFKSVKTDRLYSFHNRINTNGANDYWESAAIRPDLLLADYLHILHPDLLPDHALYFCKKVD